MPTTGPEFGPGLSNHGPMGAEALVTLGRSDVIDGWSQWYARRLAEHPEARNPIEPSDWREPLGDLARAGDWIVFFERELRERPWRDVLGVWVARLGPGIMAGATHGILRTAHAVRSLARGESPQRLHELAEGLGYWAARYQELPGAIGAPGRMPVADAVAAVTLVEEDRRRHGLIFDEVRLVETGAFAGVINYVDTSGDPGAFVSDITRTFVRQYLAHANTASIAFVHTVTAPSALRILAPHLSDATLRAAMAYAWQACAAVYAAHGSAPAPADHPAPAEELNLDTADLIEQAVAARDEHAIKFTEACLREYAITPDPAFITAARDIVVRYGGRR